MNRATFDRGPYPTPPSAGALPPPEVDRLDEREVDSMVQAVLSGAREFLGMDVAFIGQFRAGRRVFRYVDSRLDQSPIRPGMSDPLEDTYCARVVDGRLPGLIPDTAAVPEAMRLAVTGSLPVGSHISVPITLEDGRIFGTLCAFSAAAAPTLGEQQLGALNLVSNLLSASLGAKVLVDEQRADVVTEILAVAADRRFTTVFQPITDLETRRPVGFEALTRFERGTPDEWFTKAAEAGVTVELELAALDAAMRHVPEIPQDAYVAVNLSPAALCSPEFAERVPDLPMRRLVIELTEHTQIRHASGLEGVIRDLRELGARIAVDDAGSGYAGLQRILVLAPDILKLDLELIRGIDTDPARQSLALAMAGFAERTGATLVAEGIETAAQLEMLRSLGVSHGQGHYLGRPAPASSFRSVPRPFTGSARSPRKR